jgi:hypothetical protein
MCGIAGHVPYDSAPIDRDLDGAMTAGGPSRTDACGYYLADGVWTPVMLKLRVGEFVDGARRQPRTNTGRRTRVAGTGGSTRTQRGEAA